MSAVAAPVDYTHRFENGVSVYTRHLMPHQLQRYALRNLHEPVEEEWFTRVIASLVRPRPVLVDVGAAIGYYCLLAKRLHPSVRVYAFEPLDLHRQYLAENVRLNDFPSGDIAIYPQAVSATNRRARLIEQDFGSRLDPERPQNNARIRPRDTALRMRSREIPQPKLQRVRTTTLDAFHAGLGGSIDLIKVDIQGEELNLLRGAARCLCQGAVQHWIMGTHGRGIHNACIRMLKSHGYESPFERPRVDGQPDGLILARLPH